MSARFCLHITTVALLVQQDFILRVTPFSKEKIDQNKSCYKYEQKYLFGCKTRRIILPAISELMAKMRSVYTCCYFEPHGVLFTSA